MASFGNCRSIYALDFSAALYQKLITISLQCAARGWKLQVDGRITIEISILMHFNCIVMGWASVHSSVNET